jgi:glyoxylase-like metal-dependent hydrolase (beta-lactamase superfamily II)
MDVNVDRTIEFPYSPYPLPGELRQLANGFFWARIPLPFRLDHVNAWVVDDGDGWAIVDCGIDNSETRELWTGMLSGFLFGRPIRRVIATHGHTDHVGIAKFLRDPNDAQFEATLTEWLTAKLRHADHQSDDLTAARNFLVQHGGTRDAADIFDQERQRVQRYLGPQPDSIVRLTHGQQLRLGGRIWQIITGGGHADEHACFYCEADKILIAGDQILPRISPVITVTPAMPDADPLLDYFTSLSELSTLPDDVLVLPGHGEPFYGLRTRIAQLIAHHHSRLDDLVAFIRKPLTAMTATKLLFPKAIKGGQGRLAMGETIAHLHRLVALGRALINTNDSGQITFVSRD